MAKRAKGPATKIEEWTDYSTDLGLIEPNALIAAAEQAGVFAWDIETTGLSPRQDRLEGIAFYIPACGDRPAIRAWYPFSSYTFMCHTKDGELQDLRPPMPQEETMNALRPIWEDLPNTISICHNGKFDTSFLYYASGTSRPIVINNILADSMLADFCADERHRRYGLKFRVKAEFGHQMTMYADAVRGQSLLAFCNAKPLGVYAMDDCYWCYRLHERGLESLRQQSPPKAGRKTTWAVEKQLGRSMGRLERVYWGIDTKISRIIMEMETAGVLIDWRWLRKVEDRMLKENQEILDRVEQYLGWPLNPNSVKQVADALFAPPPDGLGLPTAGIPIGKSGDPSTADKVIKHFARFHPLVEDILKWRSNDTVLGGFVKKLIKLSMESPTGRIHSGFSQVRTVIGRLACVHGDTLLNTQYGSVKISELDLSKCQNYTVVTHRGRRRRIMRRFYKGRDEMFDVETTDGRSITCTAEHRFLTPFGWRTLGSLRVGSTIICTNVDTSEQTGLGQAAQSAVLQELAVGFPISRDELVCGSGWRVPQSGQGNNAARSGEREETDSPGYQGSEIYYEADRSGSGWRSECHQSCAEVTVSSIRPVGVHDVWDIEVEGDNSYVAHGFINHNSSDPINFQNQPRDKDLVRRAYCAYRDGIDDDDIVFLGGDHGQIELRVAAHLAIENNMIEVYMMRGVCTAENGGPCDRYTWYECDKSNGGCGNAAAPVELVPGVKACAKCKSTTAIVHQARCRHVDLHQRTADDAKVKRNPLAKCLDGSTLVVGMQPDRGHSWMRPMTIESLVGDIESGEHQPIPTTTLSTGRPCSHITDLQGSVIANSALKRHRRPTKIIVTKRSVVVATYDHRFQVKGDYNALDPATPGYIHEPGYSLVEAQNLEKGMELPLASVANYRADEDEFHETLTHVEIRLNPFTKDIGEGPAAIKMDEDWAYFAGLFHGDGCASGNACAITHGNGDEYANWRQTVREACDAVGLPTSVSKDKRQTRLGSRVVRRYLEGMGLCKEKDNTGEKTMRVPWWVMQGGPKLVWSYLAGLFDTDGTVGNKNSGTTSVTTKYPEFAGQIAFLLRWLGMPVLVQPGFNKAYERWYYTIHVLGEGLDRFLRYCPMRFQEKVERLRDRCATIKRKCAPTDDEVLLVLDGGERTVYDFQVESDDHLYLQGGLIGHNNLNFGMLYRMGAPKFCVYADLFDADGMPMVAYAKDVIERWFKAYPAISIFHEKVEYDLESNDWVVETIFGRRRRLDQERRINHFRAVTQGIQFMVSGSAQDIMKAGMIRVSEERDKKIANAQPAERKLWERFKFLLQIHDEIICEVPKQIKDEAAALVRTSMESIGNGFLRVPLIFETRTGPNWDTIH